MTAVAATLLVAAVCAGPPEAAEAPPRREPPPRTRAVAAALRAPMLVGPAADLSAAFGAGIGVRAEAEAPGARWLVGALDVEHDRFGRVVAVDVELTPAEDPAGAGGPAVVHRAQRLTYTRFLATAAVSPRLARGALRPRIGVGAGAALAFYLHPGAAPTSATRWSGLVRAEAALAASVYEQVIAEVAGEWNALVPSGDGERLDFRDGAGKRAVRPFGNYPAAVARVRYAF